MTEVGFLCRVPTCSLVDVPQYTTSAYVEVEGQQVGNDRYVPQRDAPDRAARWHWEREHALQSDAERGWDRPQLLLGVEVSGIRPLWSIVTEET